MNDKERTRILTSCREAMEAAIARQRAQELLGDGKAMTVNHVMPLMVATAIANAFDEYDKIVEARRFGGPVE